MNSRSAWFVVGLSIFLIVPMVSADDEEEEAAGEDAPAKAIAQIAESNFDRWVFQEVVQVRGNRRVQQSSSASAARAKIDSQLKATLAELTKGCDLTEAQQRTLLLAARGDIKQFFDRVEVVRKKFLAVKDQPDGINQIWTEISPLQQQFGRGLFGRESLFAKTLRKTLTPEQQAKHELVLLNRRRAGYRAAIEATLSKLGNGVVLRPEQQETLLKLLLEKTSPPLVYGHFDHQVTLLKLSQLPEGRVKQVLDKSQWKQVRPLLLQASGTEDYLTENGVIDEPQQNSVVIIRSVRTVVEPQNEPQPQ